MQPLAINITGRCQPCCTARSRTTMRPPAAALAAAPTAARRATRGGSSSGAAAAAAASRLAAPPPPARQVQARVRLSDLDAAANEPDGNPLAAQALQEYMQLEQSSDFNAVTVGNLRLKYGVRRGDDGRLQLRRSDGVWMQAKLDAEVAGLILLRNTADDRVFVLQTDRFEQVDLSDDYLVLMMFADPIWEQQLMPIQLSDAQGNASQLEMSQQEFFDVVGVIRSLQQASEEAMASMPAGARPAIANDDGTIDVTAEVAPGSSSSSGAGSSRR